MEGGATINPEDLDKESFQLAKTPVKNLRCSRRTCFITSLIISIMLLVTLAALLIYFLRPESDFEPPSSEIYTVTAKITMKTSHGKESKTTNTTANATIFALSSSSEVTKLLLTGGIIENKTINSGAKINSDAFFYFEIESDTGKILKMVYDKSEQTNSTKSFIQGVVSSFMVNSHDSEYKDYSHKCKQDLNIDDNLYCQYYKKQTEETGVTYSRKYDELQAKFKSEIYTNENVKLKVESHSKVNKHTKKVESSSSSSDLTVKMYSDTNIETLFNSKTYTKFNFSFVKKITDDEMELLENLVDEMLEKDIAKPQSKIRIPGVSIQIEENHDDFPESKEEEYKDDGTIVELEDDDHKDDRMLLNKVFTTGFFKFLDYPFELGNYMYTTYFSGSSGMFLCSLHRFLFYSSETKLLKSDLCVTSINVKTSAKTTLSKYKVKDKVKIRFAEFRFDVFVIELYAVIKSANIPYAQTFMYDYDIITTEVTITSELSVEITGEVSAILVKCGVTFKTGIASNIYDNMYTSLSTGKNLGRLSLAQTFQAKLSIWFKYLELGLDCYDFFGLDICFPTLSYSKKKEVYSENYAAKFYPRSDLWQELI